MNYSPKVCMSNISSILHHSPQPGPRSQARPLSPISPSAHVPGEMDLPGCAVCLLTWDWPITDHGDDQWQIPRRCNEMYYKVPIIRPVATLTACYYLLCIHQPCIPFIRSIKWGHVNIVKILPSSCLDNISHLSRIFDARRF